MSAQGELLSDVFHLLAQPIVAMRAAMELALTKPLTESASRMTLERCLQLLDRLTEDVALAREVARLEEEAPRESCDAGPVLREIVEEFAPVAAEEKVKMELQLDMGTLWCSESVLRRALFLMLDTTLSGVPAGGHVTVQLRQDGDGYRLEMRPGAAAGTRRELCRGLLRSSGASAVELNDVRSVATFQKVDPGRSKDASSEAGKRVVPKGPSRVAGGRKAETGS